MMCGERTQMGHPPLLLLLLHFLLLEFDSLQLEAGIVQVLADPY